MTEKDHVAEDHMRIVPLIGTLDGDMVELAMLQLAKLNAESNDWITVNVTLQGGSVEAAWAIYDLIRSSSSPVMTVSYGVVASAGFVVYLAGAVRLAGPSTRFIFHMPFTPLTGDNKVNEPEIERLRNIIVPERERLVALYVERTKRPKTTLLPLLQIDARLNAKEAVALGIAHDLLPYVRHPTPKRVAKTQKRPKKGQKRPSKA